MKTFSPTGISSRNATAGAICAFIIAAVSFYEVAIAVHQKACGRADEKRLETLQARCDAAEKKNGHGSLY